MPKLSAREIDDQTRAGLPPGYARTLAGVLQKVDRAVKARGGEARAVYDTRTRSVAIEGTPYAWRIDAYPPEVLAVEAIEAVDRMTESNPLERYRKDYRLSYPKLAARLGLPTGTVYKICRTGASSLQMRASIKEKLGIPLEDWPTPPRDAHRPVDPESRRQRRLAARDRRRELGEI